MFWESHNKTLQAELEVAIKEILDRAGTTSAEAFNILQTISVNISIEGQRKEAQKRIDEWSKERKRGKDMLEEKIRR